VLPWNNSLKFICRKSSRVRKSSSRKLELKFIHIPKTAGTAIEDAGRKAGLWWGRFDRSDHVGHINSSCMFWHEVPISRDESVRTFCVMREPFDRILSEIRYELALEGRSCLSEQELNFRVDFCARKGQHMDCHWIPQYEYVKHCDHILRYDHLHHDFNVLMKAYGYKVRLPEQHTMPADHVPGMKSANHYCNLGTANITFFGKRRASRFYYLDTKLYDKLGENVMVNGMGGKHFRDYLYKLTVSKREYDLAPGESNFEYTRPLNATGDKWAWGFAGSPQDGGARNPQTGEDDEM